MTPDDVWPSVVEAFAHYGLTPEGVGLAQESSENVPETIPPLRAGGTMEAPPTSIPLKEKSV